MKIEASVVIKRPVEQVFEFVANPENDIQWQSGVPESKKTSEGPYSVGTTISRVNQFMGRRIESTSKVTEYEPNKRVSIKSTSGPFPYEGTTSFESVEGGTKVTQVGQGEVGGFFKLAEPLVRRQAQRQSDTDFAALKDLLESGKGAGAYGD